MANISLQQLDLNLSQALSAQRWIPDAQSGIEMGAETRRKLFECDDQNQILKNLNAKQDSIILQPVDADELKKLQILPSPSQFQANQLQQRLSQLPIIDEQSREQAPICQDFLGKLNKLNKCKLVFLEYLSKKQFKKLGQFHFQMINDLTNYSKAAITEDRGNQQQQQSKKKQQLHANIIQNFIINKTLKQLIMVFNPEKTMVLNCFVLIILLLQIFVFPLKLGFEYDITSSAQQNDQQFNIHQLIYYTYYSASTFILCIDVLCKLNTGVYDHGFIIWNRKAIMNKYIRERLIFDAINIIGIYLDFSSFILIPLLLLIRAYLIGHIVGQIDDHYQIQQKFPMLYQLTKLVLLILTIAHNFGCGFHYITIGQEQSWIIQFNLNHQDWTVQYLNALYFSIITMISIGYGDIVPVTIQEKIYVMAMTLVACGIFGYVVGQVGQMFNETQQKEAEFKMKKFQITTFMNQRNINKSSQNKVLQYLKHINNQQRDVLNHQQADAILNSLPFNLKQEVYIDFYGRVLNSQPVFKNIFSSKFLNELSMHMKEKKLGPNDIIMSPQKSEEAIYFIIKGQIEQFIQTENRQVIVGHLREGDMFGFEQFFASQRSDCFYQSLESSHLIYCEKHSFMELTRQYPEEYEQFCMTKDKFIFNHSYVNNMCKSCSKDSHTVLQCPLVFYNPNQYKIIRRSQVSFNQNRKPIKRRSKSKIHILKENKEVRRSLKKFRIDLLLSNFVEINNMDFFLNQELDDKTFLTSLPKLIKKTENNNEMSGYELDNVSVSSSEDELDNEISSMTKQIQALSLPSPQHQQQQPLQQQQQLQQPPQEEQSSDCKQEVSAKDQDSVLQQSDQQSQSRGISQQLINNDEWQQVDTPLLQKGMKKQQKTTSFTSISSANNLDQVQTSQQQPNYQQELMKLRTKKNSTLLKSKINNQQNQYEENISNNNNIKQHRTKHLSQLLVDSDQHAGPRQFSNAMQTYNGQKNQNEQAKLMQDFESMKEYKFYFPQHNSSIICKLMKKKKYKLKTFKVQKGTDSSNQIVKLLVDKPEIKIKSKMICSSSSQREFKECSQVQKRQDRMSVDNGDMLTRKKKFN